MDGGTLTHGKGLYSVKGKSLLFLLSKRDESAFVFVAAFTFWAEPQIILFGYKRKLCFY